MNWAFIAVILAGVWLALIAFAIALLKAGADEDAARLAAHGMDCSCIAHREGLQEWSECEEREFPQKK